MDKQPYGLSEIKNPTFKYLSYSFNIIDYDF